MKHTSRGILLAVAILVATAPTQPIAQGGPLRFSVTLPGSAGSQPVDGRLLVMLAKDPRAGEPRFQINDSVTGQLIFGVDVDGLRPGSAATIDGSAIGFPLDCLGIRGQPGEFLEKFGGRAGAGTHG